MSELSINSLYIHIPFCKKKCRYCDFISFEEYLPQYIYNVVDEIPQGSYKTVYIGGGTPSLLPLYFMQIIPVLGNVATEETTFEVNPGTAVFTYLRGLAYFDINRLSIGFQSTHDRLLKLLGRTHSAEDALRCFDDAVRAGFSNINIDLMFGLPGQSLDDWAETLDTVCSLGPTHISLYSLTPAEGTPLWADIESGEIVMPPDELNRRMYHMAREKLSKYRHYEISNFALPGFESRHNTACWRLLPYRGVGLGAHSFDGLRRWRNTEDLSEYMLEQREMDIVYLDVIHLTEQDLMGEYMMLGLRMLDGVHEADFRLRFGKELVSVFGNEINALIAKGLLVHNNGAVRLSDTGLDFANRVFAEFI